MSRSARGGSLMPAYRGENFGSGTVTVSFAERQPQQPSTVPLSTTVVPTLPVPTLPIHSAHFQHPPSSDSGPTGVASSSFSNPMQPIPPSGGPSATVSARTTISPRPPANTASAAALAGPNSARGAHPTASSLPMAPLPPKPSTARQTATPLPGFSSLEASQSIHSSQSASSSADNPHAAAMAELDQIHNLQLVFLGKIEAAKRQQEALDAEIEMTGAEVADLRTRTATVNTHQDVRITTHKLTYKLEKQIERLRARLSMTDTENGRLKKDVDNLRKEKLHLLSAKSKIEKSTNRMIAQSKAISREMNGINERRLKVKAELNGLKTGLLGEMDSFSHDLHGVKQQMASLQEQVVQAMKEKANEALKSNNGNGGASMMMTGGVSPIGAAGADKTLASSFGSNAAGMMTGGKRGRGRTESGLASSSLTSPTGVMGADGRVASTLSGSGAGLDDDGNDTLNVLKRLLDATGANSIDELLPAVQSSEEENFTMFKSILTLNEEMEDLELQTNALMTKVQVESKDTMMQEAFARQRRQETEEEMNAIKVKMHKYESEYSEQLELLRSLADSLLHLLKTVVTEQDNTALQTIMSVGLNERNIETVLGILDERIDALLQLSNAAANEPVGLDELSKPPEPIMSPRGGRQSSLTLPTLPNVQDDGDDEDDKTVQPINVAKLQELMSKKVAKQSAGSSRKRSTTATSGVSANGGSSGRGRADSTS